MEFEIGSKIKFKNMPVTFPNGIVTWVNENRTLQYKLDRPMTRMGYDKTEKLENPIDIEGSTYDYFQTFAETHSKANTVSEGTCSFDDVERI